MSGDVHVRFCEGVGVRLPRATHLVCAFQDQTDTERFYNVLGQRVGKCGLALSDATTRIIPFSRHRHAGKTSVECLGFEFRWGKDRKGKDHLKRRTARKTLRSALKRFTAWCKEHRHLRLSVLFQRLNAKRRGYYNYYGVHGNVASLQEFFNSAMRILLKWLTRRSQRHSYTWQGYTAVLERFKVARPRIVGRPKTRQATRKTSADLRQRVFLKSPVRENRTPGSVRGRSGNWPSYRDGNFLKDAQRRCTPMKRSAIIVIVLARPGGNITGVSVIGFDLGWKQLELLKEAVPGMSHVAVLLNPTNPGHTLARWPVMEDAARALGLTLSRIEVRGGDEFDRAFAAIATAHPDALFVGQDAFLFSHRAQIVDFAAQHRLPMISMYREWADAGGLLTYGASLREVFRQVAVFVDKLLKGGKPEELPVEQVMRLELIINLKTAKALGLTIPPVLLFRADAVLE